MGRRAWEVGISMYVTPHGEEGLVGRDIYVYDSPWGGGLGR